METDAAPTTAPRDAAFSFVCLGVGGGPLESNCSGYLMKPADRAWSDGTTLLEAGSWLGALVTLLREPQHAFYDVSFPECSAEGKAEIVNAWVRQALISHGHLDHIFGLVLASAARRTQCPVYGLKDTLETILGVFNGRIWPKLASYDASNPMAYYHLRPMEIKQAVPLVGGLTVRAFPISHGASLISDDTADFSAIHTASQFHPVCGPVSGHLSTTVSTAFVFTHTQKDCDVLFMGDVEPDTVSGSSLNRHVLEAVAPRAAQGKLRAIFLECSYGSSQPNEFLFGHLTPRHLYNELHTLAECVRVERGAKDTKDILRGVKCVVIHVKDMMLPGVGVPCRVPDNTAPDGLGPIGFPTLPIDLHSQIAAELASLEAEAQLGVELIMAKQGLRIEC
ncbi:3',5'-cyclic-nucleotide phosphodiesterase [Malassezia brasiliensis]|uniref:3',5'-cyclic-nucleotide phosphodiesterase n=1 Tax=Malassezia brasiliensis TaxID=1821822 RepID=A0AAF0DR94_9BASI|nr:3',5'-cyclic-nucleotide phosphodiesterase [Malassezia brasiliensis]